MLVQDLISPVAIESGRRCAQKHARLLRKFDNRFSQKMGPVYPTVMDAPLFLVRPTTFSDIFSGEIDDRIEPVQGRRIDFVLIWMPFDFPGARSAANQPGNFVTFRFQARDERRTNQSTRARNYDFHSGS